MRLVFIAIGTALEIWEDRKSPALPQGWSCMKQGEEGPVHLYGSSSMWCPLEPLS